MPQTKLSKSTFAVHLGREIKSRRGLSPQDAIASAAGIEQSTLSLYERGLRVPDAFVLVRLAEALECDVLDLLP